MINQPEGGNIPLYPIFCLSFSPEASINQPQGGNIPLYPIFCLRSLFCRAQYQSTTMWQYSSLPHLLFYVSFFQRPVSIKQQVAIFLFTLSSVFGLSFFLLRGQYQSTRRWQYSSLPHILFYASFFQKSIINQHKVALFLLLTPSVFSRYFQRAIPINNKVATFLLTPTQALATKVASTTRVSLNNVNNNHETCGFGII